MALRFLQIFLPDDANCNLEELLDKHEILGTWCDANVKERIVIHLLVPAEESEAITDRFEDAYEGMAGFRIILLPVEAVLPRPEVVAATESADVAVVEESPNGALNEPGRVSREELYSDITETLGLNRVFIAMTVLSSIVAAVGLTRDDVAVIIGAMVIAPLLGPNVAMALATTLGDLQLLWRALLTNVIGLVLAMSVSLMVGLMFTIDPSVPAIANRTHLGIGDLALALAAGSAGTFAFTRGLAGAVIGVMVAVALMPPLVTFGMLLASGHVGQALGALLLLSANVICINLAGVATFLAQGVRPRTWWEEKRAKHARKMAIVTWLVLLITLSIMIYVTYVTHSDTFGR